MSFNESRLLKFISTYLCNLWKSTESSTMNFAFEFQFFTFRKVSPLFPFVGRNFHLWRGGENECKQMITILQLRSSDYHEKESLSNQSSGVRRESKLEFVWYKRIECLSWGIIEHEDWRLVSCHEFRRSEQSMNANEWVMFQFGARSSHLHLWLQNNHYVIW